MRRGQTREIAGRTLYVERIGAGGSARPPIVVLHGFPGSSREWVDVADRLAADPEVGRDVLLFDLPGYGRSGKPADADYSLFVQADVVEALLAVEGIERCVLLAHDMGDTVAAELCARQNEGRLGVAIERVVLTNGSIFIDQARLTRGQRLTLRLPARRSLVPMPTFVLRRSLAESFARGAPAPDGAIDALVEEIRRDGGDRMMPVLIRYIEERRRHQERWTAGLVDLAAPIAAVWGTHDPIAVPAMVDRLARLRPDTTVVRLPDVGHWPSIEAPEVLADRVRGLLLAQG